MLSRYPFENTITEVKVGGTTTFDYFKKGAHKGSNVLRLIETMGWNKDECVYFGDKLHPGGNDETVIGVIDTVAVKDHHETFSHLRDAFAK
jgi:hydroxymethylpyrimidine pyrophosphatase-like HAD family hydrolase